MDSNQENMTGGWVDDIGRKTRTSSARSMNRWSQWCAKAGDNAFGLHYHDLAQFMGKFSCTFAKYPLIQVLSGNNETYSTDGESPLPDKKDESPPGRDRQGQVCGDK